MSRDDLIEKVAQFFCVHVFSGEEDQIDSVDRAYAEDVVTLIEDHQAEPLTSTREPSTTEIGPEGSPNPTACRTCGRPFGEGVSLDCGGDCLACTGGFVHEYRPVFGPEVVAVGSDKLWGDSEDAAWRIYYGSEFHKPIAVERRLVGRAERVPEENE